MTIVHPKGYKFGLNSPKHASGLPRVSDYADKTVPAPAEFIWNWSAVAWQMFRNGPEPSFPMGIGCCTCAEVGNTYVQWGNFIPTDDDIVALYSAVSGYNPANPMSDVGSDVATVENYMLNTGIRGHKFDAIALVDFTNLNEMKQALNWFGGLDIGVNIPASLDLNATVWDAVKDNSTGAAEGHCMRWVGYDKNGICYCVTWGGIQQVTEAFLTQNLTACGAAISLDMLNKSGAYINGLNLTQLTADIKSVTPAITTGIWDAINVWWRDQSSGTRIAVYASAGIVAAFALYMGLRATGIL